MARRIAACLSAAIMAGRAGLSAAGAGAAGGVGGGAALALAAASTSNRVMAPPGPVPLTAAGSTPNSLATRIASGEIRKRAGAGWSAGPGAGAGCFSARGGGAAAAGVTGRTGGGAIGGTGLMAGGVGTAGASPSAAMSARTVPTGTFSPSCTVKLCTMPFTNTSISIAPFSVSTTAITSPRLMRSPGLTSHCTRVPASMSAPSDGIRNSITFAHHRAHGLHHRRRLRQRRFLQMPGIGHRYFGAAYARNRRVEFVKRTFHDARADLGRDAAAAPSFVDYHRAMGPRHRGENRFGIQRAQRAQVEYLGVDAARRQLLGGAQRLAQRAAVGNQADIRAGAAHRSMIDLDRAGIGRQL